MIVVIYNLDTVITAAAAAAIIIIIIVITASILLASVVPDNLFTMSRFRSQPGLLVYK